MNTKSIKRAGLLLAAGAVAMVLPSMAHAQDTPPPPPPAGQQGPPPGGGRGMMDPDRRVQRMTQELNLTADQQTSIKAILVDGQKKMMDLRQNSSMSQDDRRTQMMALRTDQDTKIKAVLTADQKTKYDAMEQQMRNRMGGGPGGPGGPPPPNPQL
jgi:periplasmic protein CpxP/Spy